MMSPQYGVVHNTEDAPSHVFNYIWTQIHLKITIYWKGWLFQEQIKMRKEIGYLLITTEARKGGYIGG